MGAAPGVVVGPSTVVGAVAVVGWPRPGSVVGAAGVVVTGGTVDVPGAVVAGGVLAGGVLAGGVAVDFPGDDGEDGRCGGAPVLGTPARDVPGGADTEPGDFPGDVVGVDLPLRWTSFRSDRSPSRGSSA